MGLLTKNQEVMTTNSVPVMESIADAEYDVTIVLKNSGFEISTIISAKAREELLFQLSNQGVAHITDKKTDTQVHIAGGEIAAVLENSCDKAS